MNIESQIQQLNDLVARADAIRNSVKDAYERTVNVLDVCSKLGVNLVGIGKRTDEFKDSKGFPFGSTSSIFADGYETEYYMVKGVRKERRGSWPIAWQIARKAGIAGGCGNSGQHQVNGQFIDGVYRCKDGVWSKDE